MKVIISPRAIGDLASISDFIANDNPARARSFVAELRAACRDLETFPRRFPPFPALGPNAHRRSHGNYIIVYEAGAAVEIVAVVHAARNLDALF